jgi:hypothetical protein
MGMREANALDIAARCHLAFVDGAWLVPSQTSPTTKFHVTLHPAVSCACEYSQVRNQWDRPCNQVISVHLVAERNRGDKVPTTDTETLPKKRTHRKTCIVYNAAQRQETAVSWLCWPTCAVASLTRRRVLSRDTNLYEVRGHEPLRA